MNDFNTSFVVDQSPEEVFKAEWVGTTISFDSAEKGDQTEVRFAHLGLLPQFECFGVCSNAWGSLMGISLPSLIATGTGHPYK